MRLSHFSSLRSGSKGRLLSLTAGALALVTALSAKPACAQQVWADEFNTTTFNSNGAWNIYQPWQMLGRTQFGLTPTMGTDAGVSYARMMLRSYNDGYSASSPMVQGTEIFSKQAYKMGTGMPFEARVRGVNIPRGVVFGPYTYSEKGVWPDGYLKDEIDFEVLSNQGTNKFWSNIWNDWNTRYGYDNGVHNQDQLVTVAGMNYNAWTTYTTRWYPDRVEWYINGVLARTSTNIFPDDPLNLHFNMWAADSGWGAAYDPAMQPTNVASKSVNCYMDIDYVRVTKLPAPAKGTWADGDGLSAAYYPQPNFAGTPVTRIDPRLYNDWRTYSPDINIPNDNFSARWTGNIASPFTENVTFTLRADDGVRLYINNKLVIDDWITTAAKDRTATVAMTAGVKIPIKVEYFDSTGSASAMLYWSSPSMPKMVVPQCQLFPAIPADTTAPVVTLTAPGVGYSYRSISASGTATDVGTGVASVKATIKRSSDGLYWSGSAWTTTATQLPATLSGSNWTLAMTFLTQGQYTITVTALDKSNNSATVPARAFWIDTVAPNTNIATPKTGSSVTTLTSASGNCVDTGPGVASVHNALMRSKDGYWWNGTTFVSTYSEVKASVSGAVWTLTFPQPSAGAYILYAQSYDYAGNIGPWAQSNFTIAAAAKTAAVTKPVTAAVKPSGNSS